MFWLRVLNLLHVLNIANRCKADDGNLGEYATIIMDNIEQFCFSKPSKMEYDSLIKTLAKDGCVTYTVEDNRIKDVTLTYIGAHYISFILLAFCRSVILPIVVSVITTLITLLLSIP